MPDLLHNLIFESADCLPDAMALKYRTDSLNYVDLAQSVSCVAVGLLELGLSIDDRVAVYLPKSLNTVVSFFAISLAAGVFVPINPLFKASQASYLLRDCNVRVLITSKERFARLKGSLEMCCDLRAVVLIDAGESQVKAQKFSVLSWNELVDDRVHRNFPHRVDTDMASILYTSGSTGKPKGVVLSHRNMCVGAASVAEYLSNTADDCLLAVLPFSFDYGLSQLTTAFHKGGSVVLLDYLLARDVLAVVAKEKVTGLAGVPQLWNQLTQLKWPKEVVESLRYITNSGGALPLSVLNRLRTTLPNTQVYLMYGLTEAFRSTYLAPEEIDRRPDSIGKAIPNAEVVVLRKNGTHCAPGEEGELVHMGPLVAQGYWGASEETAKRFRPVPRQLNTQETAVWSGDTVKMDEEGYLYFVGRKDDMIKTSGYRVSSTEVEEVIYSTGLVGSVAALGISHPSLGQAVVVVVTAVQGSDVEISPEAIVDCCKKELPSFMVPLAVEIRDSLPCNPNGKIDRKQLNSHYQDLFSEMN